MIFALEKVADVWNHGSIIEARLMGLAKEVFAEKSYVSQSRREKL